MTTKLNTSHVILKSTICIKKWKLDRAGHVVGLKSSDNLIVYIDKITPISCCMLFFVSWVPCLESQWNQQIFSESKWQCLPLSPTTSAPLRESPKCKHSIEELQRSCLFWRRQKCLRHTSSKYLIDKFSVEPSIASSLRWTSHNWKKRISEGWLEFTGSWWKCCDAQ